MGKRLKILISTVTFNEDLFRTAEFSFYNRIENDISEFFSLRNREKERERNGLSDICLTSVIKIYLKAISPLRLKKN